MTTRLPRRAVALAGAAPVHLVGTQSNSGTAPLLQGNVKDLLPL
ncbi:hypothetical protein [Micromonospora parva]